MTDLSTKYMGLTLKNPVIVGSSGLTNSVAGIKEMAKKGAAAVVLKSLFEEQIRYEVQENMSKSDADQAYPEAHDYISNYVREHNIGRYLKLIEDARKKVDIPIIASINCVSADYWPVFARKIEIAGAHALELNVFIMPSDLSRSSEQNEQLYFDIISEVKKNVSIPVALKVSYHFSNLAQLLQKFSYTGIAALVLFNRFFSPDFNINNFEIVPANLSSTPEELTLSLRWIAIMAQRVQCDLAASTGIHSGEAVIKQILAGAQAVQIVSVLYQKGPAYIETVIKDVEKWMKKKQYLNLNEFRGKMSQLKSKDPAAYERVQFMKYFSEIA
jgi:dihydroorotate dehydrogenase (fumarate)